MEVLCEMFECDVYLSVSKIFNVYMDVRVCVERRVCVNFNGDRISCQEIVKVEERRK